MEDIQSNMDKIMAEFNNSLEHIAPKKLSFHRFSDPESTATPPKKRKYSFDDERPDSSSFMGKVNTTIEPNESSLSLNGSFPQSPWETRRLKADYVEAQARICSLKQEIEKLHKVRTEVENLYEGKLSELRKQYDFSSKKLVSTEKHLEDVRKREHSARSEVIRTKSLLAQQKHSYEDTIHTLQRTNAEMEEASRTLQNRLSNELSEHRRNSEKLEMEYALISEELVRVCATLDEIKEKANAFEAQQIELERIKQQRDEFESKVKELEYEITSYGDWKAISKQSQARLANMPELDKELQRLQITNKNLQNSLGNKLLLEEQVYDLKSRLEIYENAKTDAITLKVHAESLEKELKEWQNIAKDHCLKNLRPSAIALRARIEGILQKDIILSSDQGTNKIEKHSFETQIFDLKQQNELYIKNNNDLKQALKHHKGIMSRVQKKLMLVAKERDCFRQLVENFERDLTISSTIPDVTTTDNQLRSRVEMLEKMLSGYKEMCENMEREMINVKLMPEIPLEMTSNSENYIHLKTEIETLRMENERIKRRKEQLELELEHISMQGDYNKNQIKVVHFENNPAAEAYEKTRNQIEKLQAEVERLKRKNRKLEEDQEELTCRLNESNMTMNVRETNMLRETIESLEGKMQHMKEIYRTASLEFREVCYMLFGYKIDRVGATNYRISSMYAESDGEYLNFRLNESSILDMLETTYSIALSDMVQTQLGKNKSLPMFLSTLTIQLFSRVPRLADDDDEDEEEQIEETAKK